MANKITIDSMIVSKTNQAMLIIIIIIIFYFSLFYHSCNLLVSIKSLNLS